MSLLKSIREEIEHLTRKSWSLQDVARHWDSTDDYDDINEKTYSYYRRFTDSYAMCCEEFPAKASVLDLCARTAHGTLFFYEKKLVESAVCADVSPRMGELGSARLKAAGVDNFKWITLSSYELPFPAATFDALLCYETVEHVSEPERLLAELARVARQDALLILTTPNVLWEPVHALAAITGFHHSEGPHRFIRFGKLTRMVKEAGFEVQKSATTVLVPGGPAPLIKLGEWLEAKTQKSVMPYLGLRRILICRRAVG